MTVCSERGVSATHSGSRSLLSHNLTGSSFQKVTVPVRASKCWLHAEEQVTTTCRHTKTRRWTILHWGPWLQGHCKVSVAQIPQERKVPRRAPSSPEKLEDHSGISDTFLIMCLLGGGSTEMIHRGPLYGGARQWPWTSRGHFGHVFNPGLSSSLPEVVLGLLS